MILVTGASGFVGRALVSMLSSEGRHVRAAARSRVDDAKGIEAVQMPDLAPGADWQSLVSGIDCIIHCAARAHVLKEEAADPLPVFRSINRDATVELARAAAKAGVRRFIFISSIGVNGNETYGTPFRHDDTPSPQSPYAVAKWEAEQGLTELARETGMELVIIRPPLVMGHNAPGNIGQLQRAASKGLPLPLGGVTGNRRDLVSLATLATLVSACIDHPHAAGQVFLVSDGQALSTRDIVAKAAGLSGQRPRFLPVPTAMLGVMLRIAGKGSMASQLLGDLEVDIAHTISSLGWSPPAVH